LPRDFNAYESFIIEINLANNAEAYRAGKHPGYEKTALDGIRLSLDLINEHRIKVVLNGGALNPAGLAKEVQKLVRMPAYQTIRILLNLIL
jgi:hypothetical protein